MITSIGQAIGSTIAQVLWSGIFHQKLAKYLPASAQSSLADIYGSIAVQSSYAIDSPTSDAIKKGYGDTQRLVLITATCLHLLTWGSVVFWEDVNVKDIEQVKGLIF